MEFWPFMGKSSYIITNRNLARWWW